MSLVKDSSNIKSKLLTRLKYLYPSNNGGYKGTLVIQDATERGFKITSEQLSRYFSGKPQKNTLSESQLIWLCLRYGLTIRLVVGDPIIKDGKLSYDIGDFNEAEALKLLNKIYGKV
jgi:hypothetical protein